MPVATVDTSAIVNLLHSGKDYVLVLLNYHLLATQFVVLDIEEAEASWRSFFQKLIRDGVLTLAPMTIDELIWMAQIPSSKRLSNAELSCFIKAKEWGCSVLCDDKKAVRCARRFMEMPTVINTYEIFISAYLADYLGDSDLQEIQATWARHRFILMFDLASEAARIKMLNRTSQ